MPFNQELPEWNASGTKPPQSKLDSGWQIGERPPAGWWNWALNRTYLAIQELQNEAINTDQKGVANGLATLDALGKVPVSQLNLSATATQSSNGFMSAADKTALDNAQKWKLTESNGVAMLPAAGTNFDTVIKTGIYKYASTSNHLNSPTGTGFWIVTVEDYDNGINVLQLWKSTDSNEMYMRRKDSTGWKPFRKLTDDNTLTNTILGNKITVQSNANFIGKVGGSTTANPHTFKGLSALSTTLQPPNGSFSELVTENYRLISKLDGELSRDNHIGNGVIVQNLFSFNLIEHVQRTYGTIPGTTTADKVAWLRSNISKLTADWWGFGSSPTGNKASLSMWFHNINSWVTPENHTSGQVTRIGRTVIPRLYPGDAHAIDPNGFVHALAYAEPSDGTTASVINTDYVELQVELSTDIKTNLLLASQTEKGLMSPSDKAKLDGIEAKIDGAKDELSAQIGILSGLNTTAKDNLVSAVNELFTFANDGKTKWSSVIGSPLASSDTFTQMQTKTQTIKDTLATNLTAKGQSSVGTETLTALVNKVANIATGKVFAEGTTTGSSSELSFTRYQGTSMNRLYLTVSGLAFTPSYILIRKINQDNFSVSYDSRRPNNNTITIQDSETSGSIFKSTGNAYVNSTGFRLPVSNVEFNASYQWIAIE